MDLLPQEIHLFILFGFVYASIDANTNDVHKKSLEYDWIIVGAGSGGAVVASRLSELPDEHVLLLEAGNDENILTDIPMLVSYVLATDYNWNYKTQPSNYACLAMNSKRCRWSRGKALGGTSVVNYMVYSRGFKRDYDEWEMLGNAGWSYKDVLPYFLKAENLNVPELSGKPNYGKGGPMNIERPKWRTPLAKAFLESSAAENYSITDGDGLSKLGMSYVLTTTLNGARQSSNKAYLRPIRNRKNLHIETNARVTKIIIDEFKKNAETVEFIKGGRKYRVRARKEIILCAGSVNTPQLLMLSGIGPKYHLDELGINVINDLPGVGQNLQDHVSMAGLAFLINTTVSLIDERLFKFEYFLDYLLRGDGPYTLPGGAEAIGFLETENNEIKGYPDIELVFGPGALTGDLGHSLRISLNLNETLCDATYGPYEGRDAFNIVPVLMKPKSRGWLHLASKDPFAHPLLYHNYFSDEQDLKTMIKGIRKAIKIGLGKGFKKYGSRLLPTKFAGCEKEIFDSDNYWGCVARHYTTNLQHVVGTAKMGPILDRMSVVDERLKVRNINGLRIGDGSIMPTLPSGHTHGIIVMIAEKVADIIKEDWNLI